MAQKFGRLLWFPVIQTFYEALNINLIYPKKADDQAFKSAEVLKSAREFSHGLNFR